MKRSTRGALPLVAAWLLGCAAVAPAPQQHQQPQPQHAPSWLRLESEHFVLFTDLREPSARETILTFERLLAAFRQFSAQTQGAPQPKLDVVVFERASDFAAFSSDPRGFQVRIAPFEPLLVMPNAASLDQWAFLKHELAHSVAYGSLPFQPPWFAEGLAVYFQTAYFDPELRFVVGEAPAEMREVLASAEREPANELLAADAAELRPRFYASAWLLVHYLMSQHSEAFLQLRTGLAQGLTRDAAWSAAFPDLSADRLDQVLAQYAETGHFAFQTRPVDLSTATAARLTSLGTTDVHALQARMLLACPTCGWKQLQASAGHVEQALRGDPQHLEASLLRISMLAADHRLPAARALAQAHPEAWQAWAMLSLCEQREPGLDGHCSSATRARLGELGARSAYALMISALCQAAEGEKAEALAASAQAVRRQPADSDLLTMRADVLLALHECAALQQLLPRLRSAAHPQVSLPLISEFKACGAPQLSN